MMLMVARYTVWSTFLLDKLCVFYMSFFSNISLATFPSLLLEQHFHKASKLQEQRISELPFKKPPTIFLLGNNDSGCFYFLG